MADNFPIDPGALQTPSAAALLFRSKGAIPPRQNPVLPQSSGSIVTATSVVIPRIEQIIPDSRKKKVYPKKVFLF